MRGRAKRCSVIAMVAAIAVGVTVNGCRNELVDVDVEANESEPETYTVSYHANDATSGTVPEAQTKTEGVDLTLATNSVNLSRTGHSFAGWNTASDGGGTDYSEGATYTTNADVVLYAKWAASIYTVTFERQGGIGGSTRVTATFGLPMPTATAPTRKAKAFDGYYAGPEATGIRYYTSDMESARTWDIPADTELIASWRPYEIGGAGQAGGVVFYDKGEYTDGWRFLEAWTSDEDSVYQWKTEDTETPATGTTIGTGYDNTYNAMSGSEHPAAEVVRNATHGGYDNWSLPSKDELNLMYENLHEAGIGDFDPVFYWSSSEDTNSRAWGQFFPNGGQGSITREAFNSVRAVRAF